MSRRSITKSDVPALEWAVGAFGALIFGVMIIVLVMSGLREDAPPSITIEQGRVSRVANGYVVEFEARNEGDVTAAAVEITAATPEGEEARAEFDYLPAHSVRRGGVFFVNRPHAVRFTASGYNDP